MLRKLALSLSLLAFASPALAGPVNLLAQPVDSDGRVTLGDLFDNAGSAAQVVVGQRVGASVMLEAHHVQAVAQASGLQWSNPQGLRRIVVREGQASFAQASSANASLSRPGATVEALTYARNIGAGEIIQPADVIWSTVQAHMAPAAAPTDADLVIGKTARRALRAGTTVASRDLASTQVIARNDLVQVAYILGGIEVSVTGRATRDAATGEALPVVNLQSGRTIDAVAIGPGRAITGPAAQSARLHPQEFAAR